MSGDSTPRPPEELAKVLRSLPVPAARPEFREALRQRFLAGEAGAASPTDAADRNAPESQAGPEGEAPPEDVPTEPHSGPPRRRWSKRHSTLTFLAAAALLLLALPFTQANARPWEVVGLDGAGRIKIDNRWITVRDQDDVDEVARLIRDGARLETEGSVEVTIRSKSLLICLKPGACFVLPVDRPWWRRGDNRLLGKLLEGDVHVLTRLPEANPIHIETADTLVRLSNCSVGLRSSEDGTCVLVLKGGASIEGDEGECYVEEGERRFPCPTIGHQARVDLLTDVQRAELTNSHHSMQPMLD